MTQYSKKIIIWGLSILLFNTLLLAQNGDSYALIDLEGRGISIYEAQSLSDRLRSELVRTGKVTVVERGVMEQILAEQDFQSLGCTTDECAVEVGQLLGVTYMLAGSVGKVGTTFTIDLRKVNVESGKIESSIIRNYRGAIDGLLDEMGRIARELARSNTTDSLSANTHVWIEDFESYSPGRFPSSWTPDGNADDMRTNFIDKTVAFSGTQSLHLYGIVGGCWGALAYYPVRVSPPFELEVRVRNGNEVLTGCHPDRAGGIGLRQGTSWQNPSRTFFQFKGDGTIVAGSNTVLDTYNPFQWYTVKARYERLNRNRVQVSYWIDGAYKGSEMFDAIDNEESLRYIQLPVQEGTVWYDDIKIYKE